METDLTWNLDSNDNHKCQNCGSQWLTEQLKPIQDIEERITPGEVVPSGECPNCGALCHWLKDDPKSSYMEMRLCETDHVFLKPDKLYKFTVDPGCPNCMRLAQLYDPNYEPQHAPIKVIVRNDPDSPRPEVQLDPPLPFVVDYQETDENDFYFAHGGVRIYHTEWKNGCFSEHWYSNEHGVDSESPYAFDARLIQVPKEIDLTHAYPTYDDADQKRIAYAIDHGWITQDEIEMLKPE